MKNTAGGNERPVTSTALGVHNITRTSAEEVVEQIGQDSYHGILSLDQLRQRLPLSERSIRTAIRRRLIPAIRLPGGRKFLFDWDSVSAALKRFEHGGIE